MSGSVSMPAAEATIYLNKNKTDKIRKHEHSQYVSYLPRLATDVCEHTVLTHFTIYITFMKQLKKYY